MKSINVMSALGVLAVVAGLAACGGSGAGAGGGTTGPGASTSVATLDIALSTPTLRTGSTDSVTITITAKDSGNRALAKTPVAFGVDTGLLSVNGTTTDDKGQITASYSAGSDKQNRSATVTVTSDKISSSKQITIGGTTISLSVPPSATIGTPANFVATIKDGVNQPAAGVPVTFAAGGTSVGVVNSDAAGTASLSYTPTTGPSVAISAAGLGASASQNLPISGDKITITPALSTIPLTSGPVSVAVQWISSTVAVGGQTLRVSTTKGLFVGGVSSTNVVLDGSGAASFTLAPSGTVGDAVIQAQPVTGVASGSAKVTFVSTTPADFSIQATPSTVGPGAKASIEVLVVDGSANRNPVSGASVSFAIGNDPTGGSLDSSLATTDASGKVSVNFTPGSRPTSGADQVRIDASVIGVPGSKSTNLTVAASALFVTIGTGNKIEIPSTTEYKKDFNIRVTNSAGGAAPGAAITVRLKPRFYRKGNLVFSGSSWGLGPFLNCGNEDLNNDGVLSAGEDLNLNGRLEPRQIASVYFVDSSGAPLAGSTPGAVASGVADSTGSAYIAIRYAQSYAIWAEYEVEVTTSVGGSEGRSLLNYLLQGAAADFTNKDTPPAAQLSPFGLDVDSTLVQPSTPGYTGGTVPAGCTTAN